ncbi:Methylenetetrahydrofolate--tRNA-(uracil-5-)-methyltransferase TrmFO [compost metagenome]
MARYITEAQSKNFQPMNVNFGIFPDLPPGRRSKPERAEMHATRAISTIRNFVNSQTI